MQQASHTLIALYDATPDTAHFADPLLSSLARELGSALAKSGVGIVARPASTLMFSVLGAHEGRGATTIVLSPAGSRHEHENAYRLSHSGHMTIYTGRGALGADKTALSSAHGMVILGSDAEMLRSVLEYAQDHDMPVGILTSEAPTAVHERVHGLHQGLARDLVVSHDPATLARDLSMKLRHRAFR